MVRSEIFYRIFNTHFFKPTERSTMAFYRGYCIFIARIFSPPYEGPDIIAFLTQFFRPYDKGGWI